MTFRKHSLLDRLARILGYVPAGEQITGTVEFKRDEQPFVNLELPGGQRVYGWVDNRFPWMKVVHEPPPVTSDITTLAGIAAETHCLAESPDGYACGEEPGHDGWHRAEGSDGQLYDTWPQETP
ncbi:hypothetical protein [Mycobacterium sp. SMC-4]|uniref:hypothetical protein n=1 Tax=Mycobacterium sp. SMC-4 TaxID=2857059 RepID=UPI0021B3A841|nr:hypothetical protein [Mycobacterium sp. SMC-4]UXA19528.1 hypothetical protein KXD98_07990 [Mycobacterium sp. SMC-4]